MALYCEILSQDRLVYRGEVESVLLPGVDGVLGVLPRHMPLLTRLTPGLARVTLPEGEEYFTVMGGFAEILADSVTVFADAAENVEEIDVERAEAARQRAEKRLAETPVDSDAYLAVQAALRRANLRLEAAKRYRRDAARPGRISKS